jgi:hypothetical protein
VYGSDAWDAMFWRLLHAEFHRGKGVYKIDEYPWGVFASDDVEGKAYAGQTQVID